MCWLCGYSVKVEKNLQTLGRIKAGEKLCWGERGKVHFEAGDALLALPVASTAGEFLLSALLWAEGRLAGGNQS